MKNAPSVSYPVGRSRFLAGLLLALWLAGALVMACLAQSLGGWRLGCLAGSVVLAGACAWRFWCGLPDARLSWDGQSWHLHEESAKGGAGRPERQPGQLTVLLDLQRCLLIRFDEPGGAVARNLCAQAGADPGRWHGLRCAVFARSTKEEQPGASGATP